MYKNDIVALATELERLKKTSNDYVTSTSEIKAVAVPEQGPNAIRIIGYVGPSGRTSQPVAPSGKPNVPLTVHNKHLELSIGASGMPDYYGHYPLTEHGSLQLADKTGIPRKYYEAMLNAGMVDLTAENVNAWLSKQADRRLVRVADGKIRALLSDRYRALDNFDLAIMTMDRAKENNAQVQECSLTETRMYVKLVVPSFKESLAQGDDVVPGLVVSNSEVGDGAFRVEPFLFRLVCSNGLIGETSLYKVHLGQRLELGEMIYKDDTRKSADTYLWNQVRDIIDATFNRNVLRAFVDKMRHAQEIVIEKPKEIEDVTARNLQLSDEKKLDLIRYFAAEGHTAFGLVNAVTQLARSFPKYDDQVRLERHAGELLEIQVPSK